MTTIAFDTLKFAEATSQELATKRDLIEMKHDLLKWTIGLALGQFAFLVGILIKVMG